MVKWEYHTGFLSADAEKQKQFLHQRWPQLRVGDYAPEALIPELERFGEEGWELVSMEPVFVGKNEDIKLQTQLKGQWGTDIYTHTYLCVFKRPREG